MSEKIPRLTLELETVTPLFLAGAEARGAPELRPPSFRGALRYWLRAALGGAVGGNVNRVQQREGEVLGSAGDDEGRASAITLRIAYDTLPAPQTYRKDQSVWITKGGQRLQQPTGRDYLYWSMGETGRVERGNYQAGKQYYPAGTSFRLTLQPRLGAPGAEAAYGEAVAALWLMLNLGGVGSRSRRTGGSLSVRQPIADDGLAFALAGRSVETVAQELKAGLLTVRQRFPADGATTVPKTPAFDILAPGVCRIWVLGAWRRWEDAVEAIGAALRDFRTYREPDHRNVAAWLTGRAIPTVERAVFGLPVPYRYSQGGPAGTVQAVADRKTLDRRASPLWLKVSRTTGGVYVGVATLFKSAFLPAGGKLSARGRGSSPPISPPADYSLVENWIMEGFAGGQEVTYA